MGLICLPKVFRGATLPDGSDQHVCQKTMSDYNRRSSSLGVRGSSSYSESNTADLHTHIRRGIVLTSPQHSRFVRQLRLTSRRPSLEYWSTLLTNHPCPEYLVLQVQACCYLEKSISGLWWLIGVHVCRTEYRSYVSMDYNFR